MAVWLKETNSDKGIKLILFLISPFFSFLYSLKRIKTRSSFIVFYLVSIFFGMAFTVGNIRTAGSGDAISYRIFFEEYGLTNSLEFYDGLKEFFMFDEGKKDYYFDTIAYFLSRITDNYHVMFMVFAAIFAFFLLKTFKFLTQEDEFTASFGCYVLAYLFMINQIFNINGVRMWTAAWVGVYAIFQIFRNNNKRYFLLLFATPFFHGSFWVFIAVSLFAYLLSRFEKPWIILFFISFFVGNVALELLQDISDLLPTFMSRLIASYTDSERVKLIAEGGTGFHWVSKLMSFLVRCYLNFMVFLFIKNSTLIKSDPRSRKLYLFLLPYMTFVNFTLAVPSLGNRYIILAYPIIAYVWLVNFKDVKYKKILYLMPVVFWFSIYFQIHEYINVLDPMFYFSNPLYLIYKYLIV